MKKIVIISLLLIGTLTPHSVVAATKRDAVSTIKKATITDILLKAVLPGAMGITVFGLIVLKTLSTSKKNELEDQSLKEQKKRKEEEQEEEKRVLQVFMNRKKQEEESLRLKLAQEQKKKEEEQEKARKKDTEVPFPKGDTEETKEKETLESHEGDTRNENTSSTIEFLLENQQSAGGPATDESISVNVYIVDNPEEENIHTAENNQASSVAENKDPESQVSHVGPSIGMETTPSTPIHQSNSAESVDLKQQAESVEVSNIIYSSPSLTSPLDENTLLIAGRTTLPAENDTEEDFDALISAVEGSNQDEEPETSNDDYEEEEF